MEELEYPIEMDDLSKGFFDYGMDSLELVRVRNKLISEVGMELSPTLLLDYPTVEDLKAHLDSLRGLDGRSEIEDDIESEADSSTISVGWDTIGVPELLEIQ